MSSQRGTFAKRQREQELKDRARAKAARRAARRSAPTMGKGPEIAWDEAVRAEFTPEPSEGSVVPTDDSAD